jgi:exportin-7
LLELSPSNDNEVTIKYKGIQLCLNILTQCLSGNYINFGVFDLYKDPALNHALTICMKLALVVPANVLPVCINCACPAQRNTTD